MAISMIEKGVTIAEASAKCGFLSISAFSNSFKKRFGFSPGKLIHRNFWDLIRCPDSTPLCSIGIVLFWAFKLRVNQRIKSRNSRICGVNQRESSLSAASGRRSEGAELCRGRQTSRWFISEDRCQAPQTDVVRAGLKEQKKHFARSAFLIDKNFCILINTIEKLLKKRTKLISKPDSFCLS